MASLKEHIQEATLELLWSLWTEVGVAGLYRHHAHCAVDIEAFLLFTPWLGAADPRLLEEVDIWYERYHELIAVSRLRNLSKALKVAEVNSVFEAQIFTKKDDLNDNRNENSIMNKRNKSRLPDLSKPALLPLRLAALFGMGTRAATLTTFLCSPEQSFSASDIAQRRGYMKRAIAETLEKLCEGGLLYRIPVSNSFHYQLAKPNLLIDLIGILPEYFPDWFSILSFFVLCHRYLKQSENSSTRGRAVLAAQILKLNLPIFKVIDSNPPETTGNLNQDVEAFESWMIQFTLNLAQGNSLALKCDAIPMLYIP
jgi:hypothetical protein